MTNESEPMMTGAPTSPMVTLGRSDLREALPPNLQLAAGNGRGRSDLGDERPWGLLVYGGAYSIQIETPCQE
jgi:hypothetical protein